MFYNKNVRNVGQSYKSLHTKETETKPKKGGIIHQFIEYVKKALNNILKGINFSAAFFKRIPNLIDKIKAEIKKNVDNIVKFNSSVDSSREKDLSIYWTREKNDPSIDWSQEVEKAKGGLKNLQENVAKHPEMLKENFVSYLTKSYEVSEEEAMSEEEANRRFATWSDQKAEIYLNELTNEADPQLIRSIINLKAPLSKEEYEKEIKKEIVRKLLKDSFTHQIASEKLSLEFHDYLKLVDQSNKMRKAKASESEINKVEEEINKLWFQMREITDTVSEKVFREIGEGKFATAEFVTQGESGFIVVKKTINRREDNESCPINVEIQAHLDHKNIVKFIPLPVDLEDKKRDISYMSSGGVPVEFFVHKIEYVNYDKEFKAKKNQIDDIVKLITSQTVSIKDVPHHLETIKERYLFFKKPDIQEIIFLTEQHLSKAKNKGKAKYLKKWIGSLKVWQQKEFLYPSKSDIEKREKQVTGEINDIVESIKRRPVNKSTFEKANDYMNDLCDAHPHFTFKDTEALRDLIDEERNKLKESKNIEDQEQLESLDLYWDATLCWVSQTICAQSSQEKYGDYDPLDMNHLASFGYTLIQGLNDLHDQGITHGDLHEKNILLDPEGRVTLIDFDLAHKTEGDSKFKSYKAFDIKRLLTMFCALILKEMPGRNKIWERDDDDLLNGLMQNLVTESKIKKLFPYRHQEKKVTQLCAVLHKMHDAYRGKVSLQDVIRLPFFSESDKKLFH